MMINHQLSSLMKLTALDDKISALTTQQNAILQALEQKKSGIESLGKELLAIKNAVEKQEKSVSSLELDMATFDQQRKEMIKKRDTLKTSREFESLQKTEDVLEKKQRQTEDLLLEAWQALESLQLKYKNIEQQYAMVVTVHTKEGEEASLTLDKIASDIQHIEEEKKVVLQSIPEEITTIYTTINQRVKNPIASVEQGSCTACFSSITNKEITDLRKRKLLQCKGCFRLLYLPEMMTENHE